MKRFLRYLLTVLSFVWFFWGKIFDLFNFSLTGIVFFSLSNVLYCFENVRERIYFLIFNFTFFVFLLSRPFIHMIKGNVWWNFFEPESVNFALNSMMISLICMFVGHYLSDKFSKNGNFFDKNSYFLSSQNSLYVQNLQTISLVSFYMSFSLFILMELEKYSFMKGRDYVELYVSFESGLPTIITTIGSMGKYFFCIFLSTFPKKSKTILPAILYILSAIPDLLIGARNSIVLNSLFIFLYYFTRDSINNYIYIKNNNNFTKWIGKAEWFFMAIFSPVAMFLLGIYNYLREGQKTKMGILETIVDLFEKQGVSFDVICFAHETVPKIQDTGFKNYTFGGIIDYFLHGKISQILFGTKSLGVGHQNIEKGLYSNNFAHRMGYAFNPEKFLAGHGWGSSFIIEPYVDFGYIGVIIIGIIFGISLASFLRMMNKGSAITTICLVSLTYIFYSPRNSTFRWIEFLTYAQFWIPMIFCYTLAGLCTKRYSLKGQMTKFRRINV